MAEISTLVKLVEKNYRKKNCAPAMKLAEIMNIQEKTENKYQ